MLPFFYIFGFMKSLYLILILISTNCFSQALEKGNLVVNGGMGFPALGALYDGSFVNLQQENKVILGTFFLNAEIFITDRIGLRVSNMYAYFKKTQHLSFVEYNPSTGASQNIDYIKTETKHKFRFLVGPNFHLYRSENLDTYFGLGFGINRQSINTTYSITPTYYSDNAIFNEFNFYSPIAFRISYGLRYFINQFWAVSMEFGLGGPLASFGITKKIF